MSYLVLARKYRPQTFAEVVGQEHVTRTLANAFVQDRVHHAFLFCGPRGCGKTTTARIVGKALNCEAGPTPEPCGQCQGCRTIADGSAVDYFEMDGASNRGIDAIRELTDAVRYQPAMLRKKVYVIDEVHMLTTEAFNALLKTLEEPPPHVTFVLATTEPHKVPTTILSRCQRYDFKLVPSSRLGEHLGGIFSREGIEVEPGAVELLVRESGGSVRDALSLADQIISYVGDAAISESVVAEVLGVADRALTRSLVTALAAHDAKTALEAADAAASRGVDEVQLARAIVRYLRDLAVTQVAPDSELLIEAAGAKAELSELAGRIDRLRIKQMFERMLRACHDLADTQQPRMVLDLALIDVATAEPLLPLGDLLERLGELERRLGGAPRSPSPRGGGGGGRVSPREASSSFAEAAASLGAPSTPPTRRAGPASAAPDPREAAAAGAPTPGSPRDGKAASAAPSDAGTPSWPREAAPASASAPSRPREAAPAPNSPREAAPASAPPSRRAAAAAALAAPRPSPVPNVPVEHARQAGAPELAQPDVAREIAEPARRERAPLREPPGDEPPSIADSAARAEARTATRPVAAAPAEVADLASGSGPVAAPAPEPAAPVAAAPVDPLREWDKVITALDEAREMSLVTVYQTAKILSWTEGRVELGVSADGLTADLAASPEKQEAMRAFLTRYAGRPMELSVKRLSAAEEAAAKSILEDAAQRAEEERERLRREAREHPLTRAVLETFGAAIKEIKTNV